MRGNEWKECEVSHIIKESKKLYELWYDHKVYEMLRRHKRAALVVMVALLVVMLPWLIFGLIAMPFGVTWTPVTLALLVVAAGLAIYAYTRARADFEVEAADQRTVSKAYSLFSSWASRPTDQKRKQLERLDFTVDVEPVTRGGFDLRVVINPLTPIKTPDISRAPQEYIVTTTSFWTVRGGMSLAKILPGLENSLTHVDTFGLFGAQVSKVFQSTEIQEVPAELSEARSLQGD